MRDLTMLGTWVRPRFEMKVTPGSLITKFDQDGYKRIRSCDYLVDGDRIQLFNPRVADVKKPFIGEAKITMISRNEMKMEYRDKCGQTDTTWIRRV